MQSLTRALKRWQPQALHPADPLSVLQAQWAQIVGADVAANTRPAEIAREALIVITRSSAWSQQLAFLSEEVLAAVHARPGADAITTLRFRVGRLSQAPAPPHAAGRTARRRPGAGKPRPAARGPEPAGTLEAALERFRHDVTAAQRAREAAGWKECARCGARTHRASGRFCAPCTSAHAQERDAQVARLLYEAPWLGFAGIVPLVEGLTRAEYEAVRLALLRRWKDLLDRLRRSQRTRVTARERSIASSYVLLKSELAPDTIALAVVRDLLGDELYDIFYGNENT